MCNQWFERYHFGQRHGPGLFLEPLEERCSPSSIIDLGTLGGYNSYGLALNDARIVVGGSYTDLFYDPHAFSQNDNGTMTDLGTLGGNSSQARDINDSSQIVGSSTNADGYLHAFCSDGNALLDLGTLGGFTSEASAINDRGE